MDEEEACELSMDANRAYKRKKENSWAWKMRETMRGRGRSAFSHR